MARISNVSPISTLRIDIPPGREHDHPATCHHDRGKTDHPIGQFPKASGCAIMMHRKQKRSAKEKGRGVARGVCAHIHERGACDAGHAVHELDLGTDPDDWRHRFRRIGREHKRDGGDERVDRGKPHPTLPGPASPVTFLRPQCHPPNVSRARWLRAAINASTSATVTRGLT